MKWEHFKGKDLDGVYAHNLSNPDNIFHAVMYSVNHCWTELNLSQRASFHCIPTSEIKLNGFLFQATNLITKKELLTIDPDTEDQQLVYEITDGPDHGYVENKLQPGRAAATFTQGGHQETQKVGEILSLDTSLVPWFFL